MVAARYQENSGQHDSEEVQAIIDRYERLLDTRARLRRDANADEEFVWTANRERE